MKKPIIALIIFIIAINSVAAMAIQEEYGLLGKADFRNLQWLSDNAEIAEAHIKDEVIIRLETVNIPNNRLINIEVWGITDKGVLDLMAELQGIIKNGVVEISSTIEFDKDDDTKNYHQEIIDRRYTIMNYYFIAKYRDESAISENIALMSWIDSQVIDYDTQEVQRNRKFLLLCPDVSDAVEGRTTDEGYINMYKLRAIGEYRILFLTD